MLSESGNGRSNTQFIEPGTTFIYWVLAKYMKVLLTNSVHDTKDGKRRQQIHKKAIFYHAK